MHVGICTHPIHVLMSFYVRQIRYLLSLEMVVVSKYTQSRTGASDYIWNALLG